MSDQQHCINCLRESQGFYAYPCQQCGWSPDQYVESGLYLSPGTLLHNQYQIARMLGHGGFGITYLAWDNNLETKLAIKEYMPRDFATRNSTNAEVSTFAGDAKVNFAYGLERFLEEARTLAKFQQYTGIVSVLNYFKANGTGYMVMEYVDGFTLKEYLTHKGKLSWEQTLKLFMPVMDALREVHKHGLMHRDISPDNIYLCKDGCIKLLDFGSARYALGGHSRSLSVVVKPGYAPEEQYRTKGKQGDWTDVYSVAASMYRCVTGVVPPDALDRLDNDELVRPSLLGVQIPAEAEEAMMTAMAVKAENRTQSIEDFQHKFTKKILDTGSSQSQSKGYEKDSSAETEAIKKKLDDIKAKNLNEKIIVKGGKGHGAILSFVGVILILSAILVPAYKTYQAKVIAQAKATATELAMAQALTEAEAQAQAESESELEARKRALARVEAKTRAEAQMRIETEARAEAQTSMEAQTESQAEQNTMQTAAYKPGDILYDDSIVFYVDSSGKHGWSAKSADEEGLANWNLAMRLAESHGQGWHLPAIHELGRLYSQRNVVGGFSRSQLYWSSSENDSDNAHFQNFEGPQGVNLKSTPHKVRAVRDF